MMMEQSLIDYIIEVFDGVLLDEYGWEHYSIKGKKYDIEKPPRGLWNRVHAGHIPHPDGKAS